MNQSFEDQRQVEHVINWLPGIKRQSLAPENVVFRHSIYAHRLFHMAKKYTQCNKLASFKPSWNAMF